MRKVRLGEVKNLPRRTQLVTIESEIGLTSSWLQSRWLFTKASVSDTECWWSHQPLGEQLMVLLSQPVPACTRLQTPRPSPGLLPSVSGPSGLSGPQKTTVPCAAPSDPPCQEATSCPVQNIHPWLGNPVSSGWRTLSEMCLREIFFFSGYLSGQVKGQAL